MRLKDALFLMREVASSKVGYVEKIERQQWTLCRILVDHQLTSLDVLDGYTSRQKANEAKDDLDSVLSGVLKNRIWYSVVKDKGAKFKIRIHLKLHRYPCLTHNWSYTCPNCGSKPHYIENKKSCPKCKPIIIGILEDMIKWADWQEEGLVK